MPSSIWDREIQSALRRRGRTAKLRRIRRAPFASPADWRDQWIYFALVDRFNNPAAPPQHSWDGAHNAFQGGTPNGLRDQLTTCMIWAWGDLAFAGVEELPVPGKLSRLRHPGDSSPSIRAWRPTLKPRARSCAGRTRAVRFRWTLPTPAVSTSSLTSC